MCHLWLQGELQMSEDERWHLLKLDGSQLARLRSPEAVASKCPGVPPAFRVFIAQSVVELLRKWDSPEERTTGVTAGDDARTDYVPPEGVLRVALSGTLLELLPLELLPLGLLPLGLLPLGLSA